MGAAAFFLFLHSLGAQESGKRVAVEGVVYEDANRDGKRGPDEKGIANVRVGDSRTEAVTDAQGRYKLEVDPKESRNVWVFTSSPWAPSTSYFAKIAAGSSCDFGLRKDPASQGKEFSFIALADTQHAKTETLKEIRRQITACDRDIRFVVVLGDLIDEHPESWDVYRNAWKGLPIPIYHVEGEHDPGYEENVGPRNYAFEYGGVYFTTIGIEGFGVSQPSVEWAVADVKKHAADKPRVVFCHQPWHVYYGPLKPLTSAWIHGHMQSPFVLQTENLRDYSCPVAYLAPHDGSPPGYEIFTFKNGQWSNERKAFDISRRAALVAVSPQPQKPLEVRVTAHDSSLTVTRVEARDKEGKSESLEPLSSWTWNGLLPPRGAGKHELVVTMTSLKGEKWETKCAFEIPKTMPQPDPKDDWRSVQRDPENSGFLDRSISPPFFLAWAFQGGGLIHYSSPLVAEGKVLVGITRDTFAQKSGLVALEARSGRVEWHADLEGGFVKGTGVIVGSDYLVNGALPTTPYFTGEETLRVNLVSGKKAPYDVSVDGLFLKASSRGIWGRQYPGKLTLVGLSEGGQKPAVAWSSPNVAAGYPTLHDDFVCEGGGIFDLKTGKQVSGEIPIPRRSCWGGNRIYGSDLKAYDGRNGTLLWTVEDPEVNKGSLGYIWDVEKVGVATDGKQVYWSLTQGIIAAHADDGKLSWKTPLPAFPEWNYPCNSPVVSRSHVFVATARGHLYALNKEKGGIDWDIDLGSPLLATPTLSGNMLFVAAYDGTVYAFVSTAGR